MLHNPLSPNYQAVDYLLGAPGQADSSYSAAGTDVGDPMPRKSFRHHLFQRVVKSGDTGDPQVEIQVSLVKPELAIAEDWSIITTLSNAKPWDYFSCVGFPYLRAVRVDSVTANIKVLVSCANDLPDAS